MQVGKFECLLKFHFIIQFGENKYAVGHYYCNHIMTVASKLTFTKFSYDDILMDIPLQSKAKRASKKIPHCLSKPKQSTNRENLPNHEEEPATSSRAKRKPTQTQNPNEQPAF